MTIARMMKTATAQALMSSLNATTWTMEKDEDDEPKLLISSQRDLRRLAHQVAMTILDLVQARSR